MENKSGSKMGGNLIPKSKDRRHAFSDEDIDKHLHTDGVLKAHQEPDDSIVEHEETEVVEIKPVAKAEHKIFSVNPIQDQAIEALRRKALSNKIPGRSDILRAGIVALASMDAKQLGELLDEVHAAQSDGDKHEALYKIG